MICKLKARLNLHGILNVESGYYVEDMEVEEPIPEEGEQKDGDVSSSSVFYFLYLSNTLLTSYQAMDTKSDEPPKTRKVKKQVRKGDLPIVSGTGATEDSVKQAWTERENAMYMEDKLVAETDEKKNELEARVYEYRDKFFDGGIYAEDLKSFTQPEGPQQKIKSDLLDEMLSGLVNWLEEDGWDSTKSIYVAKMEELRSLVAPVITKFNDRENKKLEEAEEAAAAKKRAEFEAKKAEEAAKKPEEPKEGDAEMKDAPETEEKQ
jgi:heat shock protein 4